MFLPLRRGGGIGMRGPLALGEGGGTLLSCTPELPWKKKVMWKIRPWNQGVVLAQGGS